MIIYPVYDCFVWFADLLTGLRAVPPHPAVFRQDSPGFAGLRLGFAPFGWNAVLVWNQSNETVSSLAVSVSLHHSIWKLSNGCNIIPWVGCVKPAASLWFGLLVYFRCSCVSVSVWSRCLWYWFGRSISLENPWLFRKGCSRAPSHSARHLSPLCADGGCYWVVDYLFLCCCCIWSLLFAMFLCQP